MREKIVYMSAERSTIQLILFRESTDKYPCLQTVSCRILDSRISCAMQKCFSLQRAYNPVCDYVYL